MSATLWHYFFQDDFESFRKFLADATYTSSAPKTSGNTIIPKLGSSPGASAASRKVSGNTHDGGSKYVRDSTLPGHAPQYRGVISRSALNARDSFGRTLLHYAASSTNVSALEFVTALLEIPLVDIYFQDTESGWTALHRALYFGNISIAHALMLRDIKDATDFTTTVSHNQAGGLIKIKDHEGNSPFEVFGLTIAPRTIQPIAQHPSIAAGDDDAGNSVDLYEDPNGNSQDTGRHVRPIINLQGDEVFAFGSNKNLSLGLGDEDDRQYPERLTLRRPDHLLRLLQQEHDAMSQSNLSNRDLSSNVIQASHVAELPAVILHRPIIIQDVVMSKMHGAVLTTDPISNLYVCGFGPGGRLGTGGEATQFNYVPIQGGGLSHKHVSTIALGQDHCIAICSRGEVFTWGSNRHGQLGYALPETSPKEVPMQLVPRQLYGHVKKELIIGAAASAIHSAIFTITGLYTFGKNEGQLGLMDSDARSLEIQIIPRQVGVSVIRSPIQSVSAIDRATTVLLESHEVIVFTHYGFTKVVFQLELFTNFFISDSYRQTSPWSQHFDGSNSICKVTSGGNTICALSTFGEIFAIDASRKSEAIPTNVSTTNPTKARNALPPPLKLWSIKKAHMSAIDVAAGQDGSVIICTAAGSVWRKEKRAKIKSIGSRELSSRTKDYKFVRVPNLTRAVAVRSNAFGAFTAIRRDCDVTKEQIVVDPPLLWANLFDLLPFREYKIREADHDAPNPQPRFWTSVTREYSPTNIKQAILNTSVDAETEFKNLMARYEPLTETQYDMWITSNVTDVCIPIHSCVIKARSTVVRHALAEFQSMYYFSIPDVLSIEYGPDGQILVKFHGADFLTIMNLVFYLYTENVVDVWHHTSRALESAARYRQVRTELMKIATYLDLPQLEKAVRIMVEPAKSLHLDFEDAILDTSFFSDADLMVELADEVEMPAHSVLLCARCPFFEGLFHGRAGGRWIATRRSAAEIASDAVRVDLKHIEPMIFEMVLRHIYADTGAELFDKVVTEDLDEFIDLVIEVLAVANELMLDRLAQICQRQLGKFVNTRNVCQLLNAVSGCSVNEFKHVALEYICLNLESMLEHRLLEELDEDLLLELEDVVRQNQLAFMPFTRSERSQTEIFERHPSLATEIDLAKQRRVDSMRLRSRFIEDDDRPASSSKLRVGSWDRTGSSPLAQHQPSTAPAKHLSPAASPALLPNDTQNEDLFEMDEDRDTPVQSPGLGTELPSPSLRPNDYHTSRTVTTLAGDDDGWLDRRGRPLPGSLGTDTSSLVGSARRPTLAPRSQVPFDLVSGSVESPRSVWKTSVAPWAQVDLKDIMSQTPTLSSLSLGLNGISSSALKPIQKMSQKERKKVQQEQSRQSKGREAASPETPQNTRAARESTSTTTSPWKNVQVIQKSPIPIAPKQQEPTETAARSTPAKTAMTMRQTVSGASPASRGGQPKQIRGAPSLITASFASQIQSIRHSAAPSNNSFVDARTSMADILAQQQTEKTAVKEAVAKRSLQEIQQEQEFQQWWDAESRRVQEEEEQRSSPSAASSSGRRGKAGRGRGRGTVRRGGERGSVVSGGEVATKGEVVTEQPETPTSPAVDAGRRGRRGRGRGIGDGGGRSSTA